MRCKECIDANRDAQLKAPPKNETAQIQNCPPSQCCADDDNNIDASCWICLDEGLDELGKPLVRDCSCRGESGFAHLACIITYAQQKSRCVAASANGEMSDFIEPWRTCPSCKQLYVNEVGIDLATALVTFSESNYNPENNGFHLEALSRKLDALAWSDQTEDMEETKKIANKILSMVQQFKMRNYSPLDGVLQIEAQAHGQLGSVHLKEETKQIAKAAMKHFERGRDISKAIGITQDIATAEANLAMAKLTWMGGSNDERGETCQEAYNQSLGQDYEESPITIQLGMNAAHVLYQAHHVIEAERLFSKIATVSNRVHGPDHEITKRTEFNLQYSKARYVIFRTGGKNFLFQALRYEDDGEKCIAYGPLEERLSSPRNVPEGETTTFATKDVIPIPGTPVICHGLEKVSHLNGKLGDVRSWDEEKTDRYEVHFEDKGLKPCSVKSENVRILFELPDA